MAVQSLSVNATVRDCSSPYTGLHTGNNNNTLSPTSLFWAVVPIALNTMCLPSGMILGYPSSWNFAIRCSPIFCAASAAESLAQVSVYSIKNTSLRKGLIHWKNTRFADVDADENGSFANLRKNGMFQILLFVFGALWPAVKVYMTTGVVWLHVCCAPYLAAFIVDEIMTILAGRCKESSNDEVASSAICGSTTTLPLAYRILSCMVLWLSGIFTHILGLVIVFVYHSTQVDQWLFSSLRLLLIMQFYQHALLAATTLRLSPNLAEDRSVGLLAALLLIGGFCPLMLQYIRYVTLFFDGYARLGPRAELIGWFPTVVLCGLFYAQDCWLAMKSEQGAPKTGCITYLGWYYVLSHLAMLCLILAIAYDPTSTSRPTWTNWLG